MSIETLDQWNARLVQCGCCPMPECPEPSIFTEQREGIGHFCGYTMWNEKLRASSPSPTCADYRAFYGYYENRGIDIGTGKEYWTRYSRTRGANEDCNQVVTTGSDGGGMSHYGTPGTRVYSAGTFSTDWEYFGVHDSTELRVYGDKTSEADSVLEMIAVATNIAEGKPWSASSNKYARHTKGTDSYITDICPGAVTTSVTLTIGRFRFEIPVDHEGSMFKITYDIAEFPDDESIAPSYFKEDETLLWEGPGDPGEPDDWLTDWVEITPPEVPGERRIVNIRYTCYSGKFGVRPQVMGEAFELPEEP